MFILTTRFHYFSIVYRIYFLLNGQGVSPPEVEPMTEQLTAQSKSGLHSSDDQRASGGGLLAVVVAGGLQIHDSDVLEKIQIQSQFQSVCYFVTCFL